MVAISVVLADCLSFDCAPYHLPSRVVLGCRVDGRQCWALGELVSIALTDTAADCLKVVDKGSNGSGSAASIYVFKSEYWLDEMLHDLEIVRVAVFNNESFESSRPFIVLQKLKFAVIKILTKYRGLYDDNSSNSYKYASIK